MKIDEVRGPQEIPGLRGQDLTRPAERQKAEAAGTAASDRPAAVLREHPAEGSTAERVQRLRAAWARGLSVDGEALAERLREDGVV